MKAEEELKEALEKLGAVEAELEAEKQARRLVEEDALKASKAQAKELKAEKIARQRAETQVTELDRKRKDSMEKMKRLGKSSAGFWLRSRSTPRSSRIS